MIRLGIVGLASFYGPRYAARARERPDVDVTAVVPGATDEQLRALSRPTPDEFADEHDCAVVEELDGLLDGVAPRGTSIDALVIASRLGRRADDAIAALEADVSVLTAKPAADGPDGARRIADAAASAGVPAVTTSPLRFDDAVGEVADRVRDGAIGDVLRVEVSIQHDPVGAEGIDAHPEAAPNEAGTAYSMGFYAADALRWLADADPERVHAEYANRNTPHLDHPDLGTATVRFGDDALGSMTMTLSTAIEEYHQWSVEVAGTHGMLTTQRTAYGGFEWYAAGEGPEAFGRTRSPVLDRQFDAFVRAVADGAGPDAVAPDPESVARSLAVCAGWERAAEEGGPVSIGGNGY